MTDYPIYCPAQTYPQTRETPAEFCENEVEQEGDFCPVHDDEQDTPWGNDEDEERT